MAYVIAEPCIGTKDTACVDACPVDCIHPKKDEERFCGIQSALHRSSGMHRLWRVRAGLPGVGHLYRRRFAGKMEIVRTDQRAAFRPLGLSLSRESAQLQGCALFIGRYSHGGFGLLERNFRPCHDSASI